MTRKVAICGSNTFPLTTEVGAQVVDVIRALDDAVLLTRGSGPFEKFVAHVALALGLRCFTFAGHGGASNLERDQELVEACDELIAFVDPELVEVKSGTSMVIERALAAGRPVRAATVVDGTLVWAE